MRNRGIYAPKLKASWQPTEMNFTKNKSTALQIEYYYYEVKKTTPFVLFSP